jgi:hypothetical protein
MLAPRVACPLNVCASVSYYLGSFQYFSHFGWRRKQMFKRVPGAQLLHPSQKLLLPLQARIAQQSLR